MYQNFVLDKKFFALLLKLDQDLAEETRLLGCPCGGVLHRALYPRRPRGGPADLGPEYSVRWSFCCSVEGCRRRATPPSLLFLGRKVFFGVLVLLLPILREGPTPERLRRLESRYSVSRRTLYRWREWWQATVPESRWWEARRGRWARPPESESLPGSLLEAFCQFEKPADRFLETLKWLSSMPSLPNLAKHEI